MKSKYKFSELIEEISEQNTELKYGLDDIVGVTIEKGLIPTIANLQQTALNKFYIVKPDTFVYNPRTHGVRLGMGFNKTNYTYITSWNNIAFKVKDDALSILNPEYLWLYFNRSEWDRETNYHAWGSSTIVFSWNTFLNLEIQIPEKSYQDILVRQYNAIKRRIVLKQQINDNLEATAQAYFDKLFINDFECTTNLDKIANINPTRNLAKNQIARCFDMSTLPLKGCIPIGGEYKPYNGGMRFINGDTILARITPCLENGKAAYINILDENEVAFGSTEYIVLSPKENVPSSFFYFLARNSTFISYAVAHMNGSSGRQRVSGSDIANYPIKEPSKDELQMFDKYASKVLYAMKVSALEIEKLKELQENITATISSR